MFPSPPHTLSDAGDLSGSGEIRGNCFIARSFEIILVGGLKCINPVLYHQDWIKMFYEGVEMCEHTQTRSFYMLGTNFANKRL
jgi:hypothetical protein